MNRMVWKTLIAAGVIVMAGMQHAAQAQMLMGTSAYNFPARNNSFAAQAQMSLRLGGEGSGSAGGLGALQQYVYSSSSTAIGNYNSVTVGDNSQATVKGNQDSNGNQGAEATTDITVGRKDTHGAKEFHKKRKSHSYGNEE